MRPMGVAEIDLNQLPIPDWGLHCPRCRYLLRGLPSHRCPECGTALDMSAIVKPWHRLRDPRFTGRELPFPDFGFDCRGCRRPLAGARRWNCPHCGAAFEPGAFVPAGREWLVVDQPFCGAVPLAGVEILLAHERVPYARHPSRLLREIYGGTPVVGSRLLVPMEFFFEVRWLVRRAEREMVEARRHADEAWRCQACGEDVPLHFEVCWNCQAPRRD